MIMKQLPEAYREKIQSNLTIIWWGRRAFYEVVEELSSAIWWSIFFGLIFTHIGWYYEKWLTWQSLIGATLIFVYIWYYALIELELWRNEIYAVGLDPQTGDGRVYKFFAPVGKSKIRFWEVLSRASIDEAITQQSPAILPHTWWWYRVWGWFTGEKMSKVMLKTPNYVFLEGQRISPEFHKAISYVRSSQPKKQAVAQETQLGSVADITRAMLAGHITQEEAAIYTKVLFDRYFYGY